MLLADCSQRLKRVNYDEVLENALASPANVHADLEL